MHTVNGMRSGLILSVGFCLVTHGSPAFSQTMTTDRDVKGSCMSLSDAVSAAFRSSETIKNQSSDANVAAEQYLSSRAGLLPSIKASALVAKQDDSQNTATKAQESYSTTAKISLSQPLYAGGAEYAALRRASKQAEAGEKLTETSRIRVARDVLSKAFQVLLAQAELKSSTDLRDLSRRRWKEIRGRIAIGRSKSVDGLGADVQVANSDAQYETAKLALETAKRQLSTAMGQDFKSLCDVETKSELSQKSWQDVLTKVLQRPDLEAADLSVLAASESVSMARAGHRPSIEVGANYYLKRPELQKTNGKWDVSLSVSLPLYSGGMVSSKVNEALALEQKQAAIARLTKQTVSDEARDLWESYVAGRVQVGALDDAAKKSAQYYQAMASDERKGLATSLETLQALNSSIDAQRQAQKAKFKFDETVRQLELVIGNNEGALR